MEFSEKLQRLRKEKGLTQEELAAALYVSRTAISKWESGRGYPSIDSLKMIAKFFSVTVDELLSSDEVLKIAQEDSKQRQNILCDLVLGLLDLSAVMFLFLPLFAVRMGDAVHTVSLLSLCGVQPYLEVAYFITVIALGAMGIITLALQNCRAVLWGRYKHKVSLVLSALGVLLFVISLQPYPAVLLFVFLTVKVLMLIKQR